MGFGAAANCFYAFDLLRLNGQDLRGLPLLMDHILRKLSLETNL
jgi:ATP-dependent DNA ligase